MPLGYTLSTGFTYESFLKPAIIVATLETNESEDIADLLYLVYHNLIFSSNSLFANPT